MRTSIIPLFLLLAATSGAKAAEFCVTTSQQLVDALGTADSNSQDDVIRIATGNYTAPDAGGFIYIANSVSAENHSLAISGGWFEFFGNPCGIQTGSTPYDTLLNGNSGPVLGIYEGTLSSITGVEISNLSITGGDSPGEGSGLRILMGDSSGDIRIDRCAFIGNHADYGTALSIHGSERIELRGSVIAANTTDNSVTTGGALFITTSGNKGIYVINNTIVSNQVEASETPQYGGALLVANDPAQALVVNNILWGNEGYDLATYGSGDFYIQNNDIGSRTGNVLELNNNISVEPTYTGGLLNFTPAGDSELIDAGREPPFLNPIPVPFDDNWGTGTIDFVGNTRIRGERIDIGAYEGLPTRIFADAFES